MKCAWTLLIAVALTAGFVSQPAYAKDGISIKFVNQTDWDIHEIYLSSTKQDDWGVDQLRDEVIKTGAAYLLHSIPTGKYDVKIVDEDGDACVISAVKIAENEEVVLTNKDLVGCQAKTEADEADEDAAE